MAATSSFLPATFLTALLVVTPLAAESGATPSRVPGDTWQRYDDPAQAGFDPVRLESARRTWETLPSSAFLVVADGAVVASWGEVERQFMCHSVLKSFLSALYGVHWDRGEIELNKTLADLEAEGWTPDGLALLENEKQARILDLLKFRSGIYPDETFTRGGQRQPGVPERGKVTPGRHFIYSSWDFNALIDILEHETGTRLYPGFDTKFARPLGLQDWRRSDPEDEIPSWPCRASARDMARFGLLYARQGFWGGAESGQRLLSRQWIQRTTALYSPESDFLGEMLGYGMLWWVYREPRFEQFGMYAAFGVGNQMIAVVPELDLVIVNRANTYDRQGTPMRTLLDLVEQILDARTGEPVDAPSLSPLPTSPDRHHTEVSSAQLTPMVGTWAWPPSTLGLPQRTTVHLRVEGGHLLAVSPMSGSSHLHLQPDGTLIDADSHERFFVVRTAAGQDGGEDFAGLADAETLITGAIAAAGSGRLAQAETWLTHVENVELPPRIEVNANVGRGVLRWLTGERTSALELLGALDLDATRLQAILQGIGRGFLQAGHGAAAESIEQLSQELSATPHPMP